MMDPITHASLRPPRVAGRTAPFAPRVEMDGCDGTPFACDTRENGAPAGRNRSNISSLVEFPAVWFRSRSSSSAAQRTSAVQIDSIRERPSKQSLASQKRLSVVESERPSDIEKLGSPGASGSSRDDEDGEDSDDEGSFKSLNEKDVTEY